MVHQCLTTLVYHIQWPAAIPCVHVMRITFVVHTRTEGSVDRAAVWPHLGVHSDMGVCESRPMPVRYVLVPDALIRAFADDPFAVGVYVAVARLAMVAKTAMPLSARDLAVWM